MYDYNYHEAGVNYVVNDPEFIRSLPDGVQEQLREITMQMQCDVILYGLKRGIEIPAEAWEPAHKLAEAWERVGTIYEQLSEADRETLIEYSPALRHGRRLGEPCLPDRGDLSPLEGRSEVEESGDDDDVEEYYDDDDDVEEEDEITVLLDGMSLSERKKFLERYGEEVFYVSDILEDWLCYSPASDVRFEAGLYLYKDSRGIYLIELVNSEIDSYTSVHDASKLRFADVVERQFELERSYTCTDSRLEYSFLLGRTLIFHHEYDYPNADLSSLEENLGWKYGEDIFIII